MNNNNIQQQFSPAHRSLGLDVLKIAVVALAYFLAHLIAFFFPDSGKVIMLIWPAGGIGLAAFLLFPRRLWLPLTLAFYISGVAASVLFAERSFMTGVGYMTANMVESISCAWLILYWAKGFKNFTQSSEILALIVGTVFVNAFSSCIGAGTSVLTRGASFIESWQSWYVADALGLLVAGPFIVAWFTITKPFAGLSLKKMIEAVAFVAIWVLVTLLVFQSNIVPNNLGLHPYFLVALLAWPAIRLGQRGVTLALMLLFVIAIFSSAIVTGPSPFDAKDIDLSSRLLELQLYLGFMAIVGYLLAAGYADLMRAENALRESQELFSLFLRHSPVYTYIKTVTPTESRILQASDNFQEMIGISSADMVGKTVEQMFPAEFAAKITADDWAVASSGKVLKLDEDLNDRHYTTIKFPLVQGDKTLLAGYTIDITERVQAESQREAALEEIRQLNANLEQRVEERTAQLREAQEQLVRNEKLTVLGQLAGGVGHELRHPLGVISNAVYFLKAAQTDATEKVKEYLNIIEDATRISEKIVNDLLDFTRVKSVDRRPLSVPDLIHKTLERFPAPASVIVSLDLPADLPQIYADPQHVVQILGNLTLNAYQAMVSTGLTGGLRRGKLMISSRTQDDMICIAVRDTGVGISPENMKKLFEPLFTTKPKGIGLGLAVSQKLAEANGGRIEVQSEVGVGSVFSIYFPIYEVDRPEGLA